jgi:histidinol dehydrogenase
MSLRLMNCFGTQACNFSNIYAPEHLIVNVEDAELWLDHLDNAGRVIPSTIT